jgi:hypothetical protein
VPSLFISMRMTLDRLRNAIMTAPSKCFYILQYLKFVVLTFICFPTIEDCISYFEILFALTSCQS